MVNELKMNKSKAHNPSTFHAGQFLKTELAKSGHDVAWLAEQSGMAQEEMENLLQQSNMDAELFVRVGHHLGESFFASLNALIFKDKPNA